MSVQQITPVFVDSTGHLHVASQNAAVSVSAGGTGVQTLSALAAALGVGGGNNSNVGGMISSTPGNGITVGSDGGLLVDVGNLVSVYTIAKASV